MPRIKLIPHGTEESQVILVRVPPQMSLKLHGLNEGAEVGYVRFGSSSMEWHDDIGGSSSNSSKSFSRWCASQVTKIQDRIECYRQLSENEYIETGSVVRIYLSRPDCLDDIGRTKIRQKTTLAREEAKKRKIQALDLAPPKPTTKQRCIYSKETIQQQSSTESDSEDEVLSLPRRGHSISNKPQLKAEAIVLILGISSATVDQVSSVLGSKEILGLGCAFGPTAISAAWQSSIIPKTRREVYVHFSSLYAATQAIKRFESSSAIPMKNTSAQIISAALNDIYIKKGAYIQVIDSAYLLKKDKEALPKFVEKKISRTSFRPSSSSVLRTSSTRENDHISFTAQTHKSISEALGNITFDSVLDDAIKRVPQLDEISSSLRTFRNADRLDYKNENVFDTSTAMRIFHFWKDARIHLDNAILRLTCAIPAPPVWRHTKLQVGPSGFPLWAPALISYFQFLLQALDAELELLSNIILSAIPPDKRAQLGFSFAFTPDHNTADRIFPPSTLFSFRH